ncbi:MAG: VacJ family lipoprotein [Campylobacterota bacterium]|nr:VacJ family lipoprotein [Campylobacterota bacterium]
MKIIYFLVVLSIAFTGCSSKNPNQPDNIIYDELTQEDDELFDEFEEEVETEEVYDPLKAYNRAMTAFNDDLFIYVLTPVSEGYNAIVHYEIRKSVSNFFKNLYYPPRVVNNLLQGKFKNSSEETGRFVINTTIGVLGLFDPAKKYFELETHNEDFGQTLGFYGVGSGPHIVLPLWGPSNLRDITGIYADSYLSSIDYTPREWFTLTDNWGGYLGVKAYEKTNEFSLSLEAYAKLKEDAIDLYPYLRDIYEQYRDKQIKE